MNEEEKLRGVEANLDKPGLPTGQLVLGLDRGRYRDNPAID